MSANYSPNHTGYLAAEKFLRDRFGISWGDDVLGIPEDGVQAHSEGSGARMYVTLVMDCTRDDVERFGRILHGEETYDA